MGMQLPTKAFLLAAGLGTRLQPATAHTPKPMLPFWNVAMLRRILGMLKNWGVTDVLINTHHLPNPILQEAIRHSDEYPRISITYEPDILGTGGGLRNAEWFLDRPFWLLNADIVSSVNHMKIIRAFQKSGTLAACWLTENAGPKTVRAQDGLIQDFHDTRNGHATFCGLQLLHPDILQFIPAPARFGSIIQAYQKAQKSRKPRRFIRAVMDRHSFWADIGTPAQYIQAHRDAARILDKSETDTFTIPAELAFNTAERNYLQTTKFFALATFPTQAELFPQRGSAREYFRLHTPPSASSSLPQSVIAMRWSEERKENDLFSPLTTFLQKRDIPVPRIWTENHAIRLMLLEDLGRQPLLSFRHHLSKTRLFQKYAAVIDILVQAHRKLARCSPSQSPTLSAPFDEHLYRWEHAYFAEHVLKAHLKWHKNIRDSILHELETLIAPLIQSPQTIIHRDLQSANIMFKGDAPVFIDYQGMRRGAAAYDLASLLADPYMDLDRRTQHLLLEKYISGSRDGRRLMDAFPLAVIQRLTQAMGAYVVLSQKPGMAHYQSFLPVAATQARRFLPHLPFAMPTYERALRHLSTAN